MKEQTIRVALIEDNLTDAARVRTALARAGKETSFQLEHFTTLKAGLDRVRAGSFDVALLDLGLPDSQGLRTLSKVTLDFPELPVLVLAGDDVSTSLLKEILSAGRNYVFKARVSAEDLAVTVSHEAKANTAARDAGAIQANSASRFAGNYAVRSSTHMMNRNAVRVLVVEDDHDDLAGIRFLLESVKAASFEITHAPRLSAALRLLGEDIDVVLLDLTLPDSRGIATLRRLREKDSSTPVIVMVQPEDRSKAVEALSKGAQDYLVKGQAGSYLLGQTILRRVASKDLTPPNQRTKKKGHAAS